MQIYQGACHCGAVRYEVKTDLEKTITCNCSMCAKMGWVLTFVPHDQFTLLAGEDQLTDYQFNKKIIHHLFCKICGVHSFGRASGFDGNESVAINVLCLDGVNHAALKPFAYNGKDM